MAAAEATSGSINPPIQPSNNNCKDWVTVLVTGATGRIGSHVARVLVQKQCYKVHALVRPRSSLHNLAGILDKIKLVAGDVTDGPRMWDVMAQVRPNYVYHYAGQCLVTVSYSHTDMTFDTNVKGTQNVLEGIRRAGLNSTRVLLAGSSTEYGSTAETWDGPVPETAPLRPATPYGVSKTATENLGHTYFISYGLPVITARYFIHIGVGGFDGHAIDQWCKQIAMAEAGVIPPVITHGNLAAKRDMTDAADSAPYAVTLLEKGVPGEAYNVASGTSMSMKELLDLAVSHARIKVTPRPDPALLRPFDEKTIIADISKFSKLTGWRPQVEMADTMQRVLEYWRQRVATTYPTAGTAQPQQQPQQQQQQQQQQAPSGTTTE